jgi:tetratricopeptide (TPR) repeat protein
MPGCEITLNGTDRHVTDDLGGITFQVEGNQKYKVRVSKPGYDSYDKTEERLGCGDQREVKASLVAKPVALRIRTQPRNCEIYLDGQKQSSGSDDQGLFLYVMSKPTVLVEARKKGYLSATKSINLVPELAGREILLALDPISAKVKLSANVENARVVVDDQRSAKPINERILLSPGNHALVIDALGYTPVKLEFSVAPDESLTREVTLERLPLPSLQSQATSLFQGRAYDDVLKLCGYIFEVDRANATANQLAGLTYLERGDLGKAAGYLEQALVGNQEVRLNIRRHPREKFELNKGHDACAALLIVGKSGVEFQGLRNAVDNFKITYDQIQVIGVQLKSNVAPYLNTKVTVGGRKRDFNFYSYDKELSLSGKPYLEMIQRLLRPH